MKYFSFAKAACILPVVLLYKKRVKRKNKNGDRMDKKVLYLLLAAIILAVILLRFTIRKEQKNIQFVMGVVYAERRI